MAQSEPQVFMGVSSEQFARLSVKAQAAGIGLNGNSGTTSKFGVEVEWNYSPETQELTIECLNAPFFVKPEDVDAKIRELVNESLG